MLKVVVLVGKIEMALVNISKATKKKKRTVEKE